MNLLFHQNFVKKNLYRKKNYQLRKLNLKIRWIMMYNFRKDIRTKKRVKELSILSLNDYTLKKTKQVFFKSVY